MKPEISYRKEEILSIENRYTGYTNYEEKKQEIITLKVQENNQEKKMTLNSSNVKDLQNHRPKNLKVIKVSTLNEGKNLLVAIFAKLTSQVNLI